MICNQCEMDTITDEDAIENGVITCPTCVKKNEIFNMEKTRKEKNATPVNVRELRIFNHAWH